MPAPSITLGTLCLDCRDAQEMARFYGHLLGWEPTFVEDNWVLMRNPAGGVGLSFQAEPGYVPPTWPETPDEQQKMMHLDVLVVPPDGGDPSGPAGQEALDAAAEVALAGGGRLAAYQPREDLRIILDPAGHPLCLFLH
jgi:catechol 2,3-dioxygenase-like lactoylglutathione lyase family enzyme